MAQLIRDSGAVKIRGPVFDQGQRCPRPPGCQRKVVGVPLKVFGQFDVSQDIVFALQRQLLPIAKRLGATLSLLEQVSEFVQYLGAQVGRWTGVAGLL